MMIRCILISYKSPHLPKIRYNENNFSIVILNWLLEDTLVHLLNVLHTLLILWKKTCTPLFDPAHLLDLEKFQGKIVSIEVILESSKLHSLIGDLHWRLLFSIFFGDPLINTFHGDSLWRPFWIWKALRNHPQVLSINVILGDSTKTFPLNYC